MPLSVTWVGTPNIDCDGTFELRGLVSSVGATVDVTLGAGGPAASFAGLRVSPGSLKKVGSAGRPFRMRGKLPNPCTGGTLALNANGELFGYTVRPNSACARLNGIPPRADANGKFQYTLAGRCCGGAGAWDVLHDMPLSTNIAKSASNPKVFQCADGLTMILVRGRLLDPLTSGVDVYGLSRNNSIVCKVRTKVLPFLG
jgi:hypothetical protein